MFKYILVIAFLACATQGQEINTNIVNKNVERVIDLVSQLVKITATIIVENTGKDTLQNYLIAIEPGYEGNASYVEVKDVLKDELKLTKVLVKGREKELFYSAKLKQALAAGRTTTLHLEITLTGALVPYPSQITQKEKQLVRYFGSHYFYSPYITTKQTTSVVTSSKTIENYSKLKPVSQSDTNVNYGPYASVPGFSLDKLFVHFESNSPFLAVTRLDRLIEVSHWGNIAVEENIEILHTGAKLKGPFSRYDYQRDNTAAGQHHSIKSYRTILPAAAHSIYYRDSNGNISTSSVRPRKDWIELELRPRFPLFGGWKNSYTLGYSVPSYQYLYKTPDGKYSLSMRLLDHVFDDMQVEELETRIVLPVGVTGVEVNLPYEVERLKDGVTHKYLDNLGRIVLRLRKNNLVENHIKDFEIKYNWQSAMLVHEPLLISGALYILFVLVIIYVRLDFSIHKSDQSKKND